MSNSESFPKNLRNLLTIGLLAGLFLAYLEVKTIFSPDQVWGKLLTTIGTITIAIYILLALLSLSVLGFSLWRPQLLERLGQSFRRMRWPLAVILIGLLVWTYLLSPWQATLTGPWTQFLIAAGLARFLAWCFNPESDQPFSWSDLALTFALFLYPRVVQELRIIFPITLISRLAIA
ncbi:MAG TPA: hypothetical protein VMT73_11915, partial [Anaerolineales bacterium]|nr:hypothetical protein [Anaerolineales bacterium]